MTYTNKRGKKYESGIYKIYSKAGHLYIGSSTQIKRRFLAHKSMLENDKHDNKKLQHYYNKYGTASLSFEVVELCHKLSLIEIEQAYIDSYNPYFNICKVAGATYGQTPWKGRHHTSEVKKRISESNIKTKGKNLKPKKIKLSKAEALKRLVDYSKSEHGREKSRQRMMGHKYWLGRKHKAETILNRMGNKNGRARKIICVETCQAFDCIIDACVFFGYSKSRICNAIKRKSVVNNKYTFIYADKL